MKNHLLIALLLAAGASCCWAKLSPLAPRPDWSRLDAYQETITRAEFQALLDRVYAPGGAWTGVIAISDKGATIRAGSGRAGYRLRFAPDAGSAKAVPAYWHGRADRDPGGSGLPLAGLKIAIDPGHLGGSWAKMEERWFQIGKGTPVTEGDMTLRVARLLVPRLTALGASVCLTRPRPGPVTSARPWQLRQAAVASLRDKNEPVNGGALTKESQRLFYRASEIRRRARMVNESIRPDLVVCLHFNAEEWGNEKKPRLVKENHLHFLVTGSWSRAELDYEDQRLEMLVKLLNRSFREELPLTAAVAQSMAKATGLPPYTYRGGAATPVGGNPYIWARNLLANRLFTCPVVYVEPYVMNSRSVFARVQAGDYDGRRTVGGVPRKSLYREYADGVAAGLANYYSRR